jgi:hypothetical protein
MKSRYIQVAYKIALVLIAAWVSIRYIWMVSPRLISLVFFASALLAGMIWAFTARWQWASALWALSCLSLLSPVDVRPTHWIGRPKMVLLVYGLPTSECAKAADQGEVWLGGCCITPNSPKWVITW